MKLLLAAFLGTTTASLLNKDSLPSTGEQWQTGKNGVEFQPGENLSPLAQEHMRRLTTKDEEMASPYEKMFVDGVETYYDEYAQAWRALGWYIDCDACDENNGGCAEERRKLEEEGVGGCPRYLLWAAYIDEEYAGNGIGEYIFWDRHSKTWDSGACEATGSSRCVKMDCHEPNTHFSLLGFFKEPDYDDWMEQLFKHEGDCLWTDEEYEFMQTERQSWPTSCTETEYMDNGQTIYYDLKPEQYGGMSIGLYTDTSCVVEYESDTISTEDVVRSMGDGGEGSIYTLAEDLAQWNDAFDVYKQCQPCKAYDLTSIVAGSGYERARNANDDAEFDCDDAAGYDDVNQCMKFRTKTQMMTASYRDVEMAGAQGTITTVKVGRYQFGSPETDIDADPLKLRLSWVALIGCAGIFTISAFRFMRAKNEQGLLREPLVASSGVAT